MSMGFPPCSSPMPEFAAPIPITTRQVSEDWVARTRRLSIDRDGYNPQLEHNAVARGTIAEENMVCSFSFLSSNSAFIFMPSLCLTLSAVLH